MWLFIFLFSDDEIMLFQERVSELMDSQKEYLEENIPTTRAQQIPKNGRCKSGKKKNSTSNKQRKLPSLWNTYVFFSLSVNDMMMIFQEALNQPVTSQQELLAESYSSTVSVRQKHERDKCKDGKSFITLTGKRKCSNIYALLYWIWNSLNIYH